MGLKQLFEYPKVSKINFGKNLLLTPFGPWFGPEVAHFEAFAELLRDQTGPPETQRGLTTLNML